MMTDKQVENLIKPLIKRQRLMELDALRKFGETIKEVGEADSNDSASLFKWQAPKVEAQKLKRHIDDLIILQLLEIPIILNAIAENEYLDSKSLYSYKKLPFLNFVDNTNLRTVIVQTINDVTDLFKQIFANPSFIIRDLQNPEVLTPTSIDDTYTTIINESLQTIRNPNLDYDTMMRRTETQLVNSGLNSVYYSEDKIHTQNLESAVRNNILDGIKLTQQAVCDEVAKQVNADGIELSAHMFSAPDHEPFQGHQFTNENWELLQSSADFEDINGQHFAGVERIIGVWNCRHYARPIVIGQSKPRYTQSQLDSFIEQNNQGYDLPNGKHLTMYECTQRQHQYEFRIRKAKEGLFFARKSGDKVLQEKYRAQIADRTDMYREFSEDCGLPINNDALEIVTK